jgi:hypothetical protein
VVESLFHPRQLRLIFATTGAWTSHDSAATEQATPTTTIFPRRDAPPPVSNLLFSSSDNPMTVPILQPPKSNGT